MKKKIHFYSHMKDHSQTHTQSQTLFFHTHRAGCYINSRKESEHVQNKN